MTTLVVGLVDAAIVLALGLAAVLVLRRRSASLRHAVLALTILCALVMPALEVLLPQMPVVPWRVDDTWTSAGTLTSDGLAIPFTTVDSPRPSQARLSWIQWLAAVWVSGSIVLATALMASLLRLRRLKALCVPVGGRCRELADELGPLCGVHRTVTLLECRQLSLLITCGFFRPVIILPAQATAWPDERCRAVLRHELAHIRRHDATLQIAGEVLRVMQWINPLVWLACRRLRQESEHACDDDVLAGGVNPTEYATHLLDVARQLSGQRPVWLSAPAIAHPSTLERRIVAMLQRHRNRTALGRRGWALAALGAAAISVPLAAAGLVPESQVVLPSPAAPDVALLAPRVESRLADVPPARPTPVPARATRAQQPMGSIAGTIVDQTGGALPGVGVELSNGTPGFSVAVITDGTGRFAARDLPPGEYSLVARLPGFATVTNRVKLAAGQNIQGSLTMPIGTLRETVTLACAGPSPAVQSRWPGNASFPMSAGRALPVTDAQAVRVGGNLRAPKKLADVKPSCPSAAPAEQNVRLTARIGPDGSVSDILAVHSSGPAPAREFVDAAVDAVRQWKFTPTLLNGQTVDVGMTVDVKFLVQ